MTTTTTTSMYTLNTPSPDYVVNALWQVTGVDGGVPPQLAYIDLRSDTKCQLASVMCSPHDSSGWIILGV